MEGPVPTLESHGGSPASGLGNLSREGTGQGPHLSWAPPQCSPFLSQGKAGGALRKQPPRGHCHPPGHAAHRPGPLSRDASACARVTQGRL